MTDCDRAEVKVLKLVQLVITLCTVLTVNVSTGTCTQEHQVVCHFHVQKAWIEKLWEIAKGILQLEEGVFEKSKEAKAAVYRSVCKSLKDHVPGAEGYSGGNTGGSK